MIGRRAARAGIATKFGNHTFRATGITAYLKNGGTLENAAAMTNHASTRTTQLYDRRCCFNTNATGCSRRRPPRSGSGDQRGRAGVHRGRLALTTPQEQIR